MRNKFQYLTGLGNIQQEDLFEAKSVLSGAVFLAPELIHKITLESCKKNYQMNLSFQQEMDILPFMVRGYIHKHWS